MNAARRVFPERFAAYSSNADPSFFVTSAWLLSLLISLPAPTAAQNRVPVTFRVQSNLVQLQVTVTDARSNFVTDLKRNDF